MSLQDQINDDWKSAMKARDPSKDALGLIRTELKNFAIQTREAGAQGTTLEDEKALEVLTKMAKQRRDSIAEYEKGGRDDLVQKETLELRVIENYLPQQLSAEELAALVDEAIAATGASSMKDMGKLMGVLMPKTKGRAEGREIQAMVKAKLG
jgi:hypothetical protein